MKTCNRCKQKKTHEEYTKLQRAKDGLSRSCKKCTRAWVKQHYDKNRVAYLAKAKIQRRRYIAWMIKLKDKSCTDCRVKYPYYVMDFDHIGPKLLNLAYYRAFGRKTVMKELESCELVCSNCHRERTYRRSHRSTDRTTPS